jgi:dipeptidyl aminopeptidase/acylaminoacyl peptidase
LLLKITEVSLSIQAYVVPYGLTSHRVNTQGRGFQKLTEAPGQHDYTSLFGTGARIQFSPSKKFFLDAYSSTDTPPTIELRTADGILLQELTKANIDQLDEIKWSPPEEFVVKAADEKTDIYGVLYKPNDFDASKKYPVIDSIYAGPQTTYVPRTFVDRVAIQAQALAQLGFIVIVVDARGTPERDKAFQDVVYENFGRNEIPDHVAAITQLAAKRAYIDLEKVGIYGLSWGGYFTLRAMLTAPDFYHVGVSLSPILDPAHAGFLHEIYLGLPAYNNEAFEYASNTNIGHKLEGKLLIIHGTNDAGCRTALQMKMAESIIRAGKFFDLIVLPERGHGLSYSELIPGSSMKDILNEMMYSMEATKRYFIEHLKPGQ